MDFGKLLTRAWQITWRWKVLWILGFLASLGSGTGTGNINYSFDGDEFAQMPGYRGEFPPEIIGILMAVACLAILVGIALWVVSVIARGGLIAGVQQVEEEGSTTFGQAWRVGVSRFWTLFGISVLAAIPIIILVIAGIVVAVGLFAGGIGLLEASEGAGVATIISAALCSGALCCGLIIVGIILSQIQIYAERAAVLEGMGWIEAFGRGWQIIKENLGATIILWLIFFVLGLLIFSAIFGAVAIVAVPFIAVVANTDPSGWFFLPVCCGGILAVILGALIGAVINTFTSATWTLAYREFIGMAPAEPAPAEPAPEGEEAVGEE